MSKDLTKNNFLRAMAWRDVGVSTIPLLHKSKRPSIKWKQYRDYVPKPAELKRFFSNGSNIGVICGGFFELVVVDFDDKEEYKRFMNECSKYIRDIFTKTYKVETPRGVHVYLRCSDVDTSIDTDRKIDIKGTAGYVVAPNSIHETGKPYKDIVEFNPDKILRIPRPLFLSAFPPKEKTVAVDWDSMKYSCDVGGVFPSPRADLDDIKRKVSILRLAMDYTNMFPERRGSEFWKGKCPLPSHNDSDPSFWVNTRLGICGCFGNCELHERATDVIGLYARLNCISYGEAVEILKEW